MSFTLAKINIEVWSDIACPFCYIAKHHFEKALEQFAHKDKVELEWKAYQLNPNVPDDTHGESLIDSFVREKGMSKQQAEGLFANVVNMAKQTGLDFHMDKVVVANTINAHRLSHFAKIKSRKIQNDIEELLFRAYFTDGKNVNDKNTLIRIGIDGGLDQQELENLFNSHDFADKVISDIQEAGVFGITSVPFFVFNRKYAISGAQPVNAFLDMLNKVYND